MRFLVLLCSLLALPAHADEARDHFEHGAVLYAATRYDAALHEFESAHAIQPMPAFVFNIARCLDRLDRRSEAVAAYERFLAASPDPANASVARERVAALTPPPTITAPVTPIALVQEPKPKPRRRFVLPGAVGGGAVLLAGIGAGLLGSAVSSFHGLEGSCAPTCSTDAWGGVQARERAGEVLLGVAGAVAVADVVLFVLEIKGRK